MPFQARYQAVRKPAVAGTFYPLDAGQLQAVLTELMAGAEPAARGAAEVKGLIVPHAGYIYSGPIAAGAFACLEALKGRVKRVILIGPAHYVPLRGLALPSQGSFETPLGIVPLDRGAIEGLLEIPGIAIDDRAHDREHCLEVELPFLQTILGPLPLIPVLVGTGGKDALAALLQRLWDETTLLIVSTDLSHYHPYEIACSLDLRTAEAIEDGDARVIGPEEACGCHALCGLLREVKRRGLAIERLDLRNSGDTAGDRRSVVGYGAWAVTSAA